MYDILCIAFFYPFSVLRSARCWGHTDRTIRLSSLRSPSRTPFYRARLLPFQRDHKYKYYFPAHHHVFFPFPFSFFCSLRFISPFVTLFFFFFPSGFTRSAPSTSQPSSLPATSSGTCWDGRIPWTSFSQLMMTEER